MSLAVALGGVGSLIRLNELPKDDERLIARLLPLHLKGCMFEDEKRWTLSMVAGFVGVWSTSSWTLRIDIAIATDNNCSNRGYESGRVRRPFPRIACLAQLSRAHRLLVKFGVMAVLCAMASDRIFKHACWVRVSTADLHLLPRNSESRRNYSFLSFLGPGLLRSGHFKFSDMGALPGSEFISHVPRGVSDPKF